MYFLCIVAIVLSVIADYSLFMDDGLLWGEIVILGVIIDALVCASCWCLYDLFNGLRSF